MAWGKKKLWLEKKNYTELVLTEGSSGRQGKRPVQRTQPNLTPARTVRDGGPGRGRDC